MLARLALALALLGAPSQPPLGGSFDFVAHALSEDGAKCAASPAARTYLTQTVPQAFASAWSQRAHADGASDFSAEVKFVLEPGARASRIEIGSAVPRAAGAEVLAGFQAVALPPFPEGAACLASQPYKLEITYRPAASWEGGARGQDQAPQPDANVPDRADFDRLLRRDLTAYFVHEPARGRSLEYELLRDSPGPSGGVSPTFYVWVRISGGDAPLQEGVARVEAVERTRFQVTRFVPADKIRADPDSIYRVFPAPVCARIAAKLRQAAR